MQWIKPKALWLQVKDICLMSQLQVSKRTAPRIQRNTDRVITGLHATQPQAHPRSMIVCGNARFTILTERLLRLEWSRNGKFEDRGTFAFPSRHAEPPPFQSFIQNGELILETRFLMLRHKPGGGKFSTDNLSIRLSVDGKEETWFPGKVDTGNLGGTRRTLDLCAGDTGLNQGLISRQGWSFYDDSNSILLDPKSDWIANRPSTDPLDWYFFGYGLDYKAALSEYTQFAGAIPMIPRFALGVWWCRWWKYSQSELLEIAKDFEEWGVPLDALAVDMDWHLPHSWTGYTWNRDLFPDPKGFLRALKKQEIQAALNLHPAEGIHPFEEAHPEFVKTGLFELDKDNRIPFQCSNKDFMHHYFRLLHHPREKEGIGFWWLDWQQGDACEMKGLDPLFWLNHLHFLNLKRKSARPLLLSRWGGLGNHRYPLNFTGDTYAIWPVLKFLPYYNATAANVGDGWVSHDIGGYWGEEKPELYVRWVQLGVVSPCLRLHSSSRSPGPERRPWKYPAEVHDALRAAFRLRAELAPYLYSMSRIAHETGLSLCRPMYYDHPREESAYLARQQYFLGSEIIAAPITSPVDPATGLASVSVWVPDGRWYEYSTGEIFEGPRWVQISGDLAALPMLVRSGGIIPLNLSARPAKGAAVQTLALRIFPGNGELDFYEDDGKTEAYKKGEFGKTRIVARAMSPGTYCVDILPSKTQCAALHTQRAYELRFEAVAKPRQVLINGMENSTWQYEETSGRLTVLLPCSNKSVLEHIEITNSKPSGSAPDSPSPSHCSEPFAHFVEYGALMEARRQFAHLVLEPGGEQMAVRAQVEWRIFGPGGQRSVCQDMPSIVQTEILPCPFQYGEEKAGLRWECDVCFSWKGGKSTQHVRSSAFFPCIPIWRVAARNSSSKADSPQEMASDLRNDRNSLPWETCEQSQAPEDPRMPFAFWPFASHQEQLNKGEPVEAFARTEILSSDRKEGFLLFRAPAGISLFLNGRELDAEDIPEGDILSGDFVDLLRIYNFCFCPVRKARVMIEPGKNVLLLHLPNSARDERQVSAALFNTNGTCMTGVSW